jgi:hypothetical protein
MESIDIVRMREHYNRHQIMLCFNGPIYRGLLEEIGCALRSYLNAEQAQPSSAMDVFAIYVEMIQNIRHYARAKNWADQDAGATVVVSRDEQGRYVVSAGNLIEHADGEALVARIEQLARLSKEELKAHYKSQLHLPRAQVAVSGAGLGLIDIARKSSLPLSAILRRLSDGRAFVSVSAVI